jgi:hypothetical protein
LGFKTPPVVARTLGTNLLDSDLHAPKASFGGHDMYPEFIDHAAVLAVRIPGADLSQDFLCSE